MTFRPTYRTIAHEAGVSPGAVSLAFHNRPGISGKTRDHILKIAEAQGYQPDPNIAKLMHHLRTRRRTRTPLTLVALGVRRATASRGHASRILEGAMEKAERLGYALEKLGLDDVSLSAKRLEEILRARGVEGLLLLPTMPVDVTERLDWSRFSVVATSHAIQRPRFNLVASNHLSNMTRLCEGLAAAGKNRIGLVTRTAFDQRIGHRGTLGYLSYTKFGGGYGIPPLLVKEIPVAPNVLRQWIGMHKPEAIVCDSPGMMTSLRDSLPSQTSQQIRWVCTGVTTDTLGQGGVVEDPEDIGRAAVTMLAEMVAREERGVPERPRCLERDGVVSLPDLKDPPPRGAHAFPADIEISDTQTEYIHNENK